MPSSTTRGSVFWKSWAETLWKCKEELCDPSATVATCCCVLQRAVKCRSVLQWVCGSTRTDCAIYQQLWQSVVVCCQVLQRVAVSLWEYQKGLCDPSATVAECCSVLQCAAAACSESVVVPERTARTISKCSRVLQSVAVCCSGLQWVGGSMWWLRLVGSLKL